MSENEPLKAVSNVVELKPGCKYLFVFKSEAMNLAQIDHLHRVLAAHEIVGISLTLAPDDELTVIQAPGEEGEQEQGV